MSDLKEALKQGVAYLESVELTKPNGETIAVEVRPLNGTEAERVGSHATKGLEGPVNESGKMQVSVDVSRFQAQQFQSDCIAVAYGLSHSGEEWTQKEVAEILLPGWIPQLSDVIHQISGMTRVRATFRQRTGGDEQLDGDGAGEAG